MRTGFQQGDVYDVLVTISTFKQLGFWCFTLDKQAKEPDLCTFNGNHKALLIFTAELHVVVI